MYIKQISINGFKSYRELNELDKPFSPNQNVIVGRNGSGKSNFFWAIRFVLNDAYTNVSREERQSLLNDNDASPTATAHVEIVFDNSDNRFPTGKPETIIRRTIGLKRDDYALDKKSATRAEIVNLLESAGFSTSNPYYIVPQGRVTALCNQRDHERLALLKDIAGSSVYETKRADSVRILEDTAVKRVKINELMQHINTRLEALDSEKQVLAEYTELDRTRRCLDFAINDRERSQITEELEEAEKKRVELSSVVSNTKDLLSEHNQLVASCADQIQSLERHVKCNLEPVREELQSEFSLLASTQIELELLLGDSTDSSSVEREGKTESLLDQVRSEIDSIQARIKQLRPRCAILTTKEREITAQLAEAEIRRRVLASGLTATRASDVNAKEEARLTDLISQYRVTQSEVIALLSASRAGAEKRQKELDFIRESVESYQMRVLEAENAFCEARANRDKLAEQRKEQWHREARADANLGATNDLVTRLERAVFAGMDRATVQGLQTARQLVKTQNIAGVHGCIYELLQVPEPLRPAFEVVAGASLFHLVVENDDVATRVLDAMRAYKEQLTLQSMKNGSNPDPFVSGVGRVTIMPLNRLSAQKDVKFPDDKNVIPMLKKMKFDIRYDVAFRQIFGKAAICADLNTASRIARQLGITAVTLQGDRVDKRGALSGGYVGSSGKNAKRGIPNVGGRASRLDCISAYTDALATREQLRQELEDARRQILSLDNEITRAISSMRSAQEVQKSGISSPHQDGVASVTEWQRKRRQHEAASAEQKKLEKQLEEIDCEIRKCEAQQSIYLENAQESMASALASTDLQRSGMKNNEDLSKVAEIEKRKQEQQLIKLADLLNELQSSLKETGRKKREADDELSECVSLLERKLVPKEMELAKQQIETKNKFNTGGVHNRQMVSADLEDTIKKTKKVQEDLAKVEIEIEAMSKQIIVKNSEIEELHKNLQKILQTMEYREQESSKSLQHLRVLRERIEAAQQRIHELGVLPSDFMNYCKEKTTFLLREVRKVRDQLKRYEGKVNKKAFEQYTNFTRQKQSLEENFRELESSANSIENLMQVLDARKNDALEKTFKQVSKNFSSVWEKLVPGGKGAMHMQKSEGTENLLNEDIDNSFCDPVSDQELEELEELEELDSIVEGTEDAEDSSEQEFKNLRKKKDTSNKSKSSKLKKANIQKKAFYILQKQKNDSNDQKSRYVGIGLRVSFGHGGADVGAGPDKYDTGSLEMGQLSGGQKSLVALAIIFAIQKCDPAPFYLFDEIDANLDAQYRSTVAKLLHSLSRNAQFILTTFRPELLAHADNFYGVTFANRASRLQCIDREEALGFVDTSYETNITNIE